MINYVTLNSSEIRSEVYEAYLEKFKNKLFGLLREKERNREWEKFLDTIMIELYGFPEEARTINYYTLCHKLSSLKYLEYTYFRKTIFECMNLIDKMDGPGDANGLL
jgi:hypothetical protein